jgi:hypothetical protein
MIAAETPESMTGKPRWPARRTAIADGGIGILRGRSCNRASACAVPGPAAAIHRLPQRAFLTRIRWPFNPQRYPYRRLAVDGRPDLYRRDPTGRRSVNVLGNACPVTA